RSDSIACASRDRQSELRGNARWGHAAADTRRVSTAERVGSATQQSVVARRAARLSVYRSSRRRGSHRRQPHQEPAPQAAMRVERRGDRSEEHTSELQSRRDLVCRLLLEKKKKKKKEIWDNDKDTKQAQVI